MSPRWRIIRVSKIVLTPRWCAFQSEHCTQSIGRPQIRWVGAHKNYALGLGDAFIILSANQHTYSYLLYIVTHRMREI